MFARKRTKVEPQGPVIRDPMAVVPIVPPHVEAKTDADGRVHIRCRMHMTSLPGRVAILFGYSKDSFRYVDLDEIGSIFFSLLDGKRTMNDIVCEMTSRLGCNRSDVEKAAISFARQLMARHIIQLKVTQQSLGESTK